MNGDAGNDVASGRDNVTSPDYDDFLYWKQEICLTPEDIDSMLTSGGGGGGGGVNKSEKEKENEERKRNEVSSWGDLGRKAREEKDFAVM